MEARASPAVPGTRDRSSNEIIDAGAIAELPPWALFMEVLLDDFGERLVRPMRKAHRADGWSDAGAEGGCVFRSEML